jgi:hypothetical protein
MNKRRKWIVGIFGGLGIAAIAVGALAFAFTMKASAQTLQVPMFGRALGHFGPGDFGFGSGENQYLADALGISLADLQAAQQEASDAAIQQAVDQGLITQEQADAMILRGSGLYFDRGLEWRGVSDASGIDYDALLANALGISVDELDAAKTQAQDQMLADAVANGELTQDQADLIKARQALQSYLDPDALFAQALGITTDQLQSYRDEGLSLSEILDEVGKTATEVRDAEQAAFEEALQQAVSDGVITQAQADQILANGFRGLGGFGCPGGFGGSRGRGGFGFPGLAPDSTPNNNPTVVPGSGL